MNTLVVLGLLACSLCVGADESDSRAHLIIDYRAEEVVQPGNKYFVAEGSPVRVRCKAIVDGDKEHTPTVGWTKVNTADWSMQKVGSDSDEGANDLVLTRVSASDAGRYDCVAHTLANQSIELFVSSDPTAPAKLGPVQRNETLTLECKANKPEWTLNGIPISDNHLKVSEDGKKLTIESPVGRRTGVYMCTASSDDIAQRQMFQVRGAPEIEHTTSSKNLMEGENAVLKCDLLGFPVPAIKWQKQNVDSDETSDVVAKKGKIELSVHKGVKDGMISIWNLDDSDSGVYTCTADNGMGSASFNITLRVKDKLAALWPFLGIVVEVLVLVTVIFIYEKRRSPKDEAVVDEEDDEEEQKKALTTGETVDVRQRGVKS